MKEFENTQDLVLKGMILKFQEYFNGWGEEEFELAFGICEVEEVLGVLVGYMEEKGWKRVKVS